MLTRTLYLLSVVLEEWVCPDRLSTVAAVFRQSLAYVLERIQASFSEGMSESFWRRSCTENKNSIGQPIRYPFFRKLQPIFNTIKVDQENHVPVIAAVHFKNVLLLE